ncbi:MAG: hypothetical protein SGCHY_003519 [Lobulomycetales sp.]
MAILFKRQISVVRGQEDEVQLGEPVSAVRRPRARTPTTKVKPQKVKEPTYSAELTQEGVVSIAVAASFVAIIIIVVFGICISRKRQDRKRQQVLYQWKVREELEYMKGSNKSEKKSEKKSLPSLPEVLARESIIMHKQSLPAINIIPPSVRSSTDTGAKENMSSPQAELVNGSSFVQGKSRISELSVTSSSDTVMSSDGSGNTNRPPQVGNRPLPSNRPLGPRPRDNRF